jgi:hypothetical protein
MEEPATAWPEGCVQLETEAAIRMVAAGKHLDAQNVGARSETVDLVLITLLRAGLAVCSLDQWSQMQIQPTAKGMQQTGYIKVAGKWEEFR